MSILTLGLGKQTGWAIFTDGVIESGSKSFHGSRFSGGGMHFLSFRNWLNSLEHKFTAVYFEEDILELMQRIVMVVFLPY